MRIVIFCCIILLSINHSIGQGMPFIDFKSRNRHLDQEQIETITSFFSDREDMKKRHIIIVMTYVTNENSGAFRRIDLKRVLEAKALLVKCGYEDDRILYRFSYSNQLIYSRRPSLLFNAYILQ